MISFQTPRELPELDVLLVLGRGIRADGELTRTGFERAEIAAELARTVFGTRRGLVMFSGGRSWRQALGGTLPPSEGGAMLRHATAYGGEPPEGVAYDSEEESESTIANLANSKPRIMSWVEGVRHPLVGVLSDNLHFVYGRAQYASRLVLPECRTIAIQIPRLMSAEDIAEERRVAYVTRAIMTGVRRGDTTAVMNRQLKLEWANKMGRRAIGSFRTLPGELELPEPHAGPSYHDVARYKGMDTNVLAGVLTGRLISQA